MRSSGTQDQGSVTVEAVGLLIPALVGCLLLLGLGFRLAATGQSLTSAAGAAARAASLQPTDDHALRAASALSQEALAASHGGRCVDVRIAVDGREFRPGGTAVVSLTCTMTVGELTGIGLPGRLTRTVTARSPIDLYSAATAR